MLRTRRAQSTLEYIILLTAIIAVVIGLVASGTVQTKLKNLFGESETEGVGKKMDDAAEKLLPTPPVEPG